MGAEARRMRVSSRCPAQPTDSSTLMRRRQVEAR